MNYSQAHMLGSADQRGSGAKCAKIGCSTDQLQLLALASPTAQVVVIRPTVSESEPAAQGRGWQSHRTAIAEAITENGFSVFVDVDLHPYPDQWAYLQRFGSCLSTNRSPPSCLPRVALIA